MVAGRSMVKVHIAVTLGGDREQTGKGWVELAFVDSREKVVKFALGKFELRVDDLFHVEAFFISNSVAKANFRIPYKHFFM